MPKDTCTLDGCERPRKYRLYCNMHQRRYRETGDAGPVSVKVMPRVGRCSVDKCEEPIRSRGLCERHYGRWLRRGTTDAYVHEVRDCLAIDCDRKAWNRGMCSKHYARWTKYGTTELPERVRNQDLSCEATGCDQKRRVGSYCNSHSRRFRKYGDPLASAPPRAVPGHLDRFWSNVTAAGDDECWPWQGTISSTGYGIYQIRGVQYKAHRLACSIGLGRDIAPDKMACHRCNNPPCCNPAHLYEGDGDTNSADMVAAGRSLRGERNNKNRLTVDQVQEIRRARGRASARVLADKYGVGPSSIQHIWHGRNWKWLPWPDHDTER